MLDLACGHGLAGLLFAALERTVEKVVLVDARRPACFDAIFEAVVRAAPWVKGEHLEFLYPSIHARSDTRARARVHTHARTHTHTHTHTYTHIHMCIDTERERQRQRTREIA